MQNALRELVWPFSAEWGVEREAIRDFMKKTWAEAVHPVNVEVNLQSVRNEADEILQVSRIASKTDIATFICTLQWWWTNKHKQPGTVDKTCGYFCRFLQSQYADSTKVTYQDNKQYPRNY